MGALGQVTCTFTINSQPFTQSFIVCRYMEHPIILGTDFTVTNFVGVVWTREGTCKMIQSNGSTVIELPDTTSGIPLVLVQSMKIRPGGNLEVPLECTRKLMNHMDIRIDTVFHHKNPNVYIPPSCVRNPNNQYSPKYMPLTIFNLSKVDCLYIGRDTVSLSPNNPQLRPTTYSWPVTMPSRNTWLNHAIGSPKGMKHYLKSHLILLLFVLQQMYQVPPRCNCRIKTYQQMSNRDLKSYVRNMDKHSPRIMRTLAQQSSYKWTLTQETVHQ